MSRDSEAELLEVLAEESFLTARLDDAITARRRALRLREQTGHKAAVSLNHQALSILEWSNGNRVAAEHHAARGVEVFDEHLDAENKSELALFGHALTSQGYFAAMTRDFITANDLLAEAAACAEKVDDPALTARVAIITGLSASLAGEREGRDALWSAVRSAPEYLDEIYAFGCSHLALVDIEQRSLPQAEDVIDGGISLSVDRDVPVARSLPTHPPRPAQTDGGGVG